jgi:Flp pilus assembly protein TadG
MLITFVAAGARLRRAGRFWRDLWRDRSASPTIMIALAMPVLAGAMGVGVDVSSWYMQKRKLQQMADSAALAGARIKAADQSDTIVVAVATRDATRNGYAAASYTIAVNTPPTSGDYASYDGAVEAIVSTQIKTLLSGVFSGGDARTISARAVAAVKTVSDPEIRKSVCMLSLVTSGDKAIFMNGSGAVVANNCSMAAWSNNARSVYLNGSGTIKGYTALLVGGYYVNGSGSYQFTAPPATYLSQGVADPYADLADPSLSDACTKTNYVVSGTATIDPGRYCGGILNSGSGTLWLNPGTYYIDGGDVSNSGSGSILCNGCTGDLGITLVFTSSSGTSLIGGLFSNGSGQISFSAPGPGASQPYTGMAVYQDRRAQVSVQAWGVYLNGSGGDRVSGVIYTPSRGVHLNGSGMVADTGKACMSIIGLNIELIGSGTMQTSDCGLMGATVPTPKTVALMLVE